MGNLDPRVYRELLTEIFSLAGRVTQCHVVYDKTTGLSSGFGFVHYEDHETAEAAMDKFRGRSIYGKPLTIDWARANNRDGNGKSDESNGQFCLFVGNLSPDVTDEQLVSAFSEYGSCTSAKCAKDPTTYKTQGFAFVSFRERSDAVAAMEAMNGHLLNNRPLRVDWAKGKTGGGKMVEEAPSVPEPKKDVPLSFEAIIAQTSINNITAYVSGLPLMTSEDKIREKFAAYGPIREIRIPDSAKSSSSETMYAFVRYMDHVSAARAIFECQAGAQVDGNTVNVHWGRDNRRPPPVMHRPPLHGASGYYHGFHQLPQQFPYPYGPPAHAQPQAQPHAQSHAQAHVQPQPHMQRPMYPSQPYAHAPPPGPVHQPSATAQHRYRPY